jgi:hypothetical protein
MMGNATYSDTQANQFSDSFGLIRYDATAKKFQVSTAVSVGARVWTDLTTGGGGTVNQIIGTANQIEISPPGGTGIVTIKLPDSVQIGSSGLFTGALAVFGTATNAIQAPNGFFSGRGLTATAAAYNAIQATGPGGVNTYGVTVRQYANFVGVNFITPLPGDSFLPGVSAQVWYYQAGGRLRISGQSGLIVDGSGSSFVEGITLSSGYINSAHGFLSQHTAFNTFQSLNGGAYLKQCVVKGASGLMVERVTNTIVVASIDGAGPLNSGRMEVKNQTGSNLVQVASATGTYGRIVISDPTGSHAITLDAQVSTSAQISVRQSGNARIQIGMDASSIGKITVQGSASGSVILYGGSGSPQMFINGLQVLTARKSDPGAASGWADATAQAWANSLRNQLAAVTGGHGLF